MPQADHRKVFGAGYHAGIKAAGGAQARGSDSDYLTADKMMLCWNPGTDQVRLVPWPDFARRSESYLMTGLACNAIFQKLDFEQRKAAVFIEAMHLIVRDKCDPLAVHRALLALSEYRDGCACDMPSL